MASSELSNKAWRYIKYSAVTIGVLMVAGIVTLMVLSRGKGEDITGIVAPALLITFLSSVVATVAAVFQRRVQKVKDIKSENDLTV
jgi:O-antigen/teichoic acid export membrane protein